MDQPNPDLVQGAFVLVVTVLLLAIALIDLRTRRIPDRLVAVLLAWAAAQALTRDQPTPLSALLGLIAGSALFLTIYWLGRGAMGLGDVKLAAALGALLGFPQVLSGLLLGIVTAGLAALLLLLTHRAGRKDSMAYGPYLALGAWVVLVGIWRP